MIPCSVKQITETGRQRQAEVLAEAARMRRSLDATQSDRAPRRPLLVPDRGWLAGMATICLTTVAQLRRVL